jgi:uncharacterized protein
MSISIAARARPHVAVLVSSLVVIDLPEAKSIDARLIAGSAIFGIGWGLVGLCLGPAIADIGFLDRRTALFVLCMIAGIGLYRLLAAIPAPTGLAEAVLDG